MVVLPMAPALGSLLPDVPAELASLRPSDMTLDSRRVREGSLFVALPGMAQDGRRFIDDALARGAVAVLAEAEGLVSANDDRIIAVNQLAESLPTLARDFYHDPSSSMAVLAVTGTNGKTSVVDFIVQILRLLGVKTGSIGTLGARLTSEVAEAANTTPDVVSLNRQLAQWASEGVDHVAMEASSHALDQGRMRGLSVHTGVFTNLSRDHLDYHGSEQAYAEAKLSLFRQFALKRAFFNQDDPVACRVRLEAQCAAMGLSLENPESDVYVQILDTRPLTLRLHAPTGTAQIPCTLSGTFNAFNLAMAVMAVAGLGYPFHDVAEAASRVSAVPGRMQVVANDRGLRVVVDYAHTPDALARALSALRPETQGDLWVVFGCGGDRDRGKRALMAAEASARADRIVVTSDNPRSEDPDAIVADVMLGAGADATAIVDRAEAIRYAVNSARAGDTVLIAGKGHEDYQEVGGERRPFSDVAVAHGYLAGVSDA